MTNNYSKKLLAQALEIATMDRDSFIKYAQENHGTTFDKPNEAYPYKCGVLEGLLKLIAKSEGII